MSDYTSPEYLRDLANHFARQDWEYTRQLDIKRISFGDDWKGWNAPVARIKRAFSPRMLLGKDRMSRSMGWKFSVRGAWAWIKVSLRTDRNLPDGQLRGSGGVITHWEEDGEYIQMVQPSVGEMLANFLIAEPQHPHAILLRAELDRIRSNYMNRDDTLAAADS